MTRPDRRGPRHAPRVPFALLVTVLVLGGLALLLVLNTASAANELQRRTLALSDDGIAAQVEQLQVQVAASAAPGNIATAAAALGMVPGGNPAFIVVGANGSATVKGHAAVVTGPPPPAAPTTKTPSKTPSTKTLTSPTVPKTSPTASKTSPTASKSSTSPTSPTSPTGGHGKHRSKHRNPTPPLSTAPSSSPSATHTPDPTVTLPGGPR